MTRGEAAVIEISVFYSQKVDFGYRPPDRPSQLENVGEGVPQIFGVCREINSNGRYDWEVRI